MFMLTGTSSLLVVKMAPLTWACAATGKSTVIAVKAAHFSVLIIDVFIRVLLLGCAMSIWFSRRKRFFLFRHRPLEPRLEDLCGDSHFSSDPFDPHDLAGAFQQQLPRGVVEL